MIGVLICFSFFSGRVKLLKLLLKLFMLPVFCESSCSLCIGHLFFLLAVDPVLFRCVSFAVKKKKPVELAEPGEESNGWFNS